MGWGWGVSERSIIIRGQPGTILLDFFLQITQWADRMVECTPITVNAATRWLRGIESKTGSDMLLALEMAFDEPRCEAVYLVNVNLI